MGLGAKKTTKSTAVDCVDTSSDSEDDSHSNPKKDYGKPRQYDPAFRGPIQDRSCTDVICCFFFVAFLAGMGVVAAFAFLYGNPDTLIYPSDYQGQICGVSNAVKDKPYAFYFDWLTCLSSSVLVTLSCPTPQVCVSQCPNKTFSVVEAYVTNFIDLSSVKWEDFICLYDINPKEYVGNDKNRIWELVRDEKCANYYLPEMSFAGRCVPITISNENGQTGNGRNTTLDEVNTLRELVDFIYGIEIIENLVDDFLNTWPYIFGALGAAMLFCFFILVIMQWIATIVVWAMLALFLALVAFGNYFCYSLYFQYVNSNKCGDIGDSTFNYLDLDCYLQSPKIWLAFSIILSVVGVILLLLILVLFQRIRIATALVEEASCALGMMVSTLFAPIPTFLLQIIFAIFWAFVMIFLTSIGSATYEILDAQEGSDLVNGTVCDKATFNATALLPARCEFVSYNSPEYQLYFQIYMVFGLFWMINFIIAFGEMSLAGAFASYYWAFSKPVDIPSIPILSSMWRSIRYHLGSLAFGSLIVTIVQMIRVMLEYVEKRIKGFGMKNVITKFILCCCQCFFWCLEKFIRYINRNAYIEIAVYGRSFCFAAKDAFFLLMRNILRASVLNSITSFLLFIFKLTVTLGVTVGAFYFFTWSSNPLLVDTKPLNYIWAPIVVIAIFSYVIAAVTFGVYDMGVDTLFLCFLEDLERHDGSLEKPYYMPKSLMDILGKRNKKAKKPKKNKKNKNKAKGERTVEMQRKD